jgi:hypothetical protein
LFRLGYFSLGKTSLFNHRHKLSHLWNLSGEYFNLIFDRLGSFRLGKASLFNHRHKLSHLWNLSSEYFKLTFDWELDPEFNHKLKPKTSPNMQLLRKTQNLSLNLVIAIWQWMLTSLNSDPWQKTYIRNVYFNQNTGPRFVLNMTLVEARLGYTAVAIWSSSPNLTYINLM